MAADVGDGGVEVVDHADGEDQIEELGGEVLFGRRCRIRYPCPARLVHAQVHAARAQRGRGLRQEARRDVAMDQQGLQCVAGRRPGHLAVHQQRQRQVLVGAGIHVLVADALVVLDHRHARVLGHEADQPLAAPRDHQVDDIAELDQFQDGLPAQVFDQRQHRLRQAGITQRALQRCRDGGVGMDRFRSAAQDHRVAGLQAQRGGVGRHVRACFVDHRDHAQRHAHALDMDSVGPVVGTGDLAHGVRQLRHFAHGSGDALQACRIEPQSIQHGAADAFCGGRFDIACIGGQDHSFVGQQGIRHRAQQGVLGLRGQGCDGRRCVAALQGQRLDVGHSISLLTIGHGTHALVGAPSGAMLFDLDSRAGASRPRALLQKRVVRGGDAS